MKFYANPYNPEAEGFYFETFEELADLSADWEDPLGCPVEEYTIEFIDGDSGDAELFQALKVDENNIEEFIEFIDEAHNDEKAAMFFLADNLGLSLKEASEMLDEVMLYPGDAKEAGEELFFETFEVPEGLKNYIDIDAFVNDMKCGGDFVEFRFAGRDWTCTNGNDV
jgi:hypothetical protein